MNTTNDKLTEELPTPTPVIPRLTQDLPSTKAGFYVRKGRSLPAMTRVDKGAPRKSLSSVTGLPFQRNRDGLPMTN